ncbi:hypothetical protein ACKWTF_005547 [Chironomus riparius]
MPIYHILISLFFIIKIHTLSLLTNDHICETKSVNITDEHVQLSFRNHCLKLYFTEVNFEVIPFDMLIDNPYVFHIRFNQCRFHNDVTFYDIPRMSIISEFIFENMELALAKNCFVNCTNLKVLTFENVTFKSVDKMLFKNVQKLNLLYVWNTNILYEFIVAVESLQKLKIFECKNCGITNLKVLEAFNSVEHIVIRATSIEQFECSNIQHLQLIDQVQKVHRISNRQRISEEQNLQLANLNLMSNEITGDFQTCHIEDVDIKHNKITTLFVQSRTLTVDATENLISTIKCDDQMDIEQLILNDNKLSDLMCISSMISLKILLIDSNNFKFFKPGSFINLMNLTIISVLNNNLNYFDPNIFLTIGSSNLVRISIDRFDFGYDQVRNFYPKLIELRHGRFNLSCSEYESIYQMLKMQDIRFYYVEKNNCNVF